MNEKICDKSLKDDIESCTEQHHSEIFTAVHVNSESLFLNLNLKWGSRVSTITTELCESASTTFESMIIAFATAMRQTTYIIDVEVREDTLFVLNQLNAFVKNVIHFQFLKLNHTLTQLTLENSCTLNDDFDMSFQFFNLLNQINKTLNFVVLNTDSAWFFCYQIIDMPHCWKGMMFKLNSTENINQYLINTKSMMMSITVSFYLTDSVASSFSINGTLVFSALSSDLKSVPLGIFYTDYAETFSADSGSYEFSSTAILLITASFTITSHISTTTSDSTISSSTANLWASHFLSVFFYFYAVLMMQMILVVI